MYFAGLLKNIGFLFLFISILICTACEDDEMMPNKMDDSLTDIAYNPVPVELNIPDDWPIMSIPADNQLTEAGVELGRHLFYDPILSADSSMACAGCHFPANSFNDPRAFSPGIDGIVGTRSAMSLLNVGFYQAGFFWDGRSPSLESQALLPVEDPIELHEDWPNVINKFIRHPTYPKMFREAFGIETKGEITKELAAKALAQFERTLISSGNSRYDRFQRGEINFTNDELVGLAMFFDEPGAKDVHCNHCHVAPTMQGNQNYFNNGLDAVDNLSDFPDRGHGEVTGDIFDNGTFKAPTLRNIELSAPYMHDGRFQTLEEVVEHYNSGGEQAINIQIGSIEQLGLNEEEKGQLVAFLKTLTDTTFINNPAHRSPF